MGFLDYWKYFNKALQFIPVIALTVKAFADGVLQPNEIVSIVDEGLDAAGIKGLDNSDIFVLVHDNGGFSVNFSQKAAEKLSISL